MNRTINLGFLDILFYISFLRSYAIFPIIVNVWNLVVRFVILAVVSLL